MMTRKLKKKNDCRWGYYFLYFKPLFLRVRSRNIGMSLVYIDICVYVYMYSIYILYTHTACSVMFSHSHSQVTKSNLRVLRCFGGTTESLSQNDNKIHDEPHDGIISVHTLSATVSSMNMYEYQSKHLFMHHIRISEYLRPNHRVPMHPFLSPTSLLLPTVDDSFSARSKACRTRSSWLCKAYWEFGMFRGKLIDTYIYIYMYIDRYTYII